VLTTNSAGKSAKIAQSAGVAIALRVSLGEMFGQKIGAKMSLEL
jgi:hypothetical protein